MAHMQKEETEENARWHLLGLSSRRRVFFKYEKRIRELSPPDKVVYPGTWLLCTDIKVVFIGEVELPCRCLTTLPLSHRTIHGGLHLSTAESFFRGLHQLARAAS